MSEPSNPPNLQPKDSRSTSSSPQLTPSSSPPPPLEAIFGDNGDSGENENDEEVSDEVLLASFPFADLNKLDQMISWPRWIIPVLPRGQLEILLQASINLARRKLDSNHPACQRFYREGLTISFTRLLTDEAVNGWKFEIHKCIFQNCLKLIELIILKLDDDCFPLLDLLAMIFNPNNKFHMYNMNRPQSLFTNQGENEEITIYARSPDSRCPRGWLIDLLNKFGQLTGFNKLVERFKQGSTLTVPLIAALLKPFGLCYEYLTVWTVETFFLPIIESVPVFLARLSDDELKKESQNEAKNDMLSGIVKSLKNLSSRVPNQDERIRELEIFRLKVILRLLQISSFNGKMNALNEVNKVIASVGYNSHRHAGTTPLPAPDIACISVPALISPPQTHASTVASTVSPPEPTPKTTGGGSSCGGHLALVDEEDWLTAERLAQWIRENRVLQVVLKDSLHQPQYVEKLEKIIRFAIKEKALTLQDLDDLWGAQSGKHEAIVKNMHDLLAKLAWDFTPEQLDHLFECFRSSWTKANKKQREKLLELIRRLAEDDKDGVMANKVLNLFWNLAHSEDIPTDIMDQALAAHVKILDYSCCQDRDSQKTEWLDKCVEELKKVDSDWVLPALKLIKEICCLYNEAPANFSGSDTSNLVSMFETPGSVHQTKFPRETAIDRRNRDFHQVHHESDQNKLKWKPIVSNQTHSTTSQLTTDSSLSKLKVHLPVRTVKAADRTLEKVFQMASQIKRMPLESSTSSINLPSSKDEQAALPFQPADVKIDPPLVSILSETHGVVYRHHVINRLHSQHSLVVLVAENLSNYMKRARQIYQDKCNEISAHSIPTGKKYSHAQEVLQRLNFLRFLLKDGRLWLCAPQAKQVWKCLAENAIFTEDREACFRWFSQLMSEEQDLDPEMNRSFFENNILLLDPSLVTESGIECFDRFFKAVNLKEGKFIIKRQGVLTEDLELIGLDYLWRILLNCSEDVVNSAIELIKEVYTNLGPSLESHQVNLHNDLISSCVDRLQAFYDTVSVLKKDESAQARVNYELSRMSRVMRLLHSYIQQCDRDYGDERNILPLCKAVRGEQVSLTIRFPNQTRHLDDIHIWTHKNEYLSVIKRQILSMIKANNINMKIDLYLSEDGSESENNREEKLVTEIPDKDEVILNAKLYQASMNAPTSPDSSSDSSAGSPSTAFENSNVEAENTLPGVILSREHKYTKFFFQLSDLGMALHNESLRETALSILITMPPDTIILEKLRSMCENNQNQDSNLLAKFDELFYGSSPTEILYSLMVIHSLLMPSRSPLSEDAQRFQLNFMKSGCGFKVVELLTRNNFLSNAVNMAKLIVYNTVLRICELVLTCIGHYLISSSYKSSSSSSSLSPSPSWLSSFPQYAKNSETYLNRLQAALEVIPYPLSAGVVREVASQIAHHLAEKDCPLLKSMVANCLPDLGYVKSVMMLCWATVTDQESALNEDIEALHRLVVQRTVHLTNSPISMVCKRGLGILTLMLVLSPHIMDQLINDSTWHRFIIDVLLICQDKSIRTTAKEQFSLIASKYALNSEVLVSYVQMLHQHLGSTVSVDGYHDTAEEFFHLFCELISHAREMRCQLPQAEELLDKELDLLYNVKEKLVKDRMIVETLLEGHLGITRELIYLLKSSSNRESEHWTVITINDSSNKDLKKYKKELIKVLIDDYIFTASRAMVLLRPSSQSQDRSPFDEVNPICTTSSTLNAAYDCLVALCTDCIPNLRYLGNSLIEMYYYDLPLSDWEYQPPIGPRPNKGFVGLKNAGATCYMNSIFQQLYMIPEIRSGILSVEGAATDLDEDFSGEERVDNIIRCLGFPIVDEDDRRSIEESRRDYNSDVLKHTQAIFGHLAMSKLQYYVPRGFWKHFKLWGEPVNLREQHDALEFFNSLVDSIDEALKTLGHPPIMTKVLGGSFADQKICKECPHRYSREEPFTTLNIDIRNHSNLLDSLEQYVKGDLLEGANAYHCEKCNRKVETVKRLCIKKLPTVLAIQLKRFDYDFERSCAIKFNDYFEFPRSLNMEPYTVNGLAKIEGEIIEEDLEVCEDFEQNQNGVSVCTKYELCGIVVHSGQASGGHYYSYILHKNNDGTCKWYKFDDGDVSECKLDDNEEMKVQCYGGEYMGEVFDQMLKRMSCRRQKRWWNAYILFYRRADTQEDEMAMRLNELTLLESNSNSARIKLPLAIERSVQRQNIKFMHIKNQFSGEYFQFMKKLLNSNGQVVLAQCHLNGVSTDEPKDDESDRKKSAEEIAMMCTQLASKFLFQTCFHTKKTLRGSALDWAEIIILHLRACPEVRACFVQNELLFKQYRFCEYLLDCPNSDVRSAFAKIVVFLAHFALHDGDCKVSVVVYGENSLIDAGVSLSDGLLQAVLSLLNKEVSEHSRHLTQYFNLFYQYASIGSEERTQLLNLNVPATFILVAMDEGPGPPIKYQYADFCKLYQVVSLLVRCCDVSSKCVSYFNDQAPLPNPYGVEDDGAYLMPIQPQVDENLYKRTFYLKKIIDDANTSEDTVQLLRFCCWENPNFSSAVLQELLWQIEYTYAYELRPHLDLAYHILMIADSWQEARIHNALRGLQEEKDGLFDTIQRNKSHYQKRAYQCIKMLVTLFSHSPVALKLLHNTPELKKKWTAAVDWLNEELIRRSTFQQAINQYAYNWSPPAQSNETSNGYYLERSSSAKITLSKASELCPPEDRDDTDDPDASDDVNSPPATDFNFSPGVLCPERARLAPDLPNIHPNQAANDFGSPSFTSNPEIFSSEIPFNSKDSPAHLSDIEPEASPSNIQHLNKLCQRVDYESDQDITDPSTSLTAEENVDPDLRWLSWTKRLGSVEMKLDSFGMKIEDYKGHHNVKASVPNPDQEHDNNQPRLVRFKSSSRQEEARSRILKNLRHF